jgi:Rho GTPase-activating protein 1
VLGLPMMFTIILRADLMHEVSLREAANLMGAHNLAIVLSPNLVASKNPIRDVLMCTVPTSSALTSGLPQSTSPSLPTNSAANSEGRATLGMVIKLCIQRYYEVFDEVVDRSEAIAPAKLSRHDAKADDMASSGPSSPTTSSRAEHGALPNDDDDEIDDAMLVMPIGPSASGQSAGTSSPPSAWATAGADPSYRPRHRTTHSGDTSRTGGSGVRSMHALRGEDGSPVGGGSGGGAYTSGKAKSMISIEKGGPVGTVGRKGTITVGRGTTRKSSGAAVEALSVTAAGFFSPPPVPSLPFKGRLSDSGV